MKTWYNTGKRKRIAKLAYRIFAEAFYKGFMERLEDLNFAGFADFLERNELVICRWGVNVTIIDLKNGRLFKAMITPEGILLVKEVQLQKNRRHRRVESCINEFLFESTWQAGKLIDLEEEDLRGLVNRLEIEGIETAQLEKMLLACTGVTI